MNNIGNYYLNMDRISNLKQESDKERIHAYYKEMLNCFTDKRIDSGTSIFNTLEQSGYLLEIRNEKIDKILS